MTENFWGPFSGSVCWYREAVLRKYQLFHGNTVKKWQNLVVSVRLACLHFTRQTEWSKSTNFNRIQDGVWL